MTLTACDSCVHNADFECFDCATARHDYEHPSLVDGCRSCKLATLSVSPRVAGHGRIGSSGKPPAAREPKNSWERGVVTDHRGVPYLNETGVVHVKDFANNRARYESEINRLATHPDPYATHTQANANT